MKPGRTKPPASKEIEIAVEKMGPGHTNPPASKEIEIAMEKTGPGHTNPPASAEIEIAVEKLGPGHTNPPASKEIEIAVEKMGPGRTKPPASGEIEIAVEKLGPGHTNPPTSKEIEIAVEKLGPGHTNPPASKEIEIAVEKLVYGGGGLGRWAGRVVLTPFTLPGEQVRVALQQEKSDVAYGRLLSVLSPAPERVSPRCPYFTNCGGCHYQHASYEYELAQKEAILRDTLRRVGRLQPPGRIEVVAGPEWEYRNRAQFHLERRRIGFMSAGSHDLCPVESCAVASPRLNAALAELGAMAHDRRFPPFLHSLELFTNETAVQLNVRSSGRGIAKTFFDWCAERIPGATTASIEYTAAGERFRVGRRSFFQVNRFLVERLVETAVGEARGDTALDLYAGVGLFTLPLARRFGEVSAVESEDSAVRDLEFNAARAGLGVNIHRGTAEAYLDQASECPDLVLADPPRAGLGRHTVARLLALRPRNLVIVSCDPATLARDLAALVGGGFSLERLTLVDLFPRTCHIETVAELEFMLSAA